MDIYEYTFDLPKKLKKNQVIKVGVAGTGNLEVIIKPVTHTTQTKITVNTPVSGFKTAWDEVLKRYIHEYPYGGLGITLNDAGATPPIVSLRLRQAIETYQTGYHKKTKYTEAGARNRIYSLVDEGSFNEFLLNKDTPSPNLPLLKLQVESDDGVVIGTAQFSETTVAIISQQRNFIGGSVGEVHGAKINGMIQYAIKHKLPALVFLIDSGGVRLQEANAGEIGISEIIRSILDARSAGIKTIGVICGYNGAYGGIGIISSTLDYLIANQGARLGVSGAEVIQAVKGINVIDSEDRSLVWRVYGGRARYLQQAIQAYTSNQMIDIRQSIINALNELKDKRPIHFSEIQTEHQLLKKRIETAKHYVEAGEWLAECAPELSHHNLFDCSDEQFLSLTNKRND